MSPKRRAAPTWERKRPIVGVTLDPETLEQGKRLADERGMTLSRFVEWLLRAEIAREERRKK